MEPIDDQRPYWDRVAPDKTFTHPLNRDWLTATIGRGDRILDYGCGYGRTLNELASMGYADAVGVDVSARMIDRGRRAYPGLDLRVIDGLPLAWPEASFDAVLLMAVLTCIPSDRRQDAVMREVRRVLRPGGILYISDMPLQPDDRNLRRYTDQLARFGTYGVFETEDGAIVRHHTNERIDALLDGFDTIAKLSVQLTTMNANAATGLQILARRRVRDP